MKRKVEGLFYHYTNGDIVNIKDLSKKEYEEFFRQDATINNGVHSVN